MTNEEEARAAIGAALGRVPSGLYIVTVRHGEQVNAFLGSWVMQVRTSSSCTALRPKLKRPKRPTPCYTAPLY